MDLLCHIAAAGPSGVALRDLHRAVGLKPTTVHSLVRSLRAGRYVEQASGTGKYRIGTGLLQLVGTFLQGSSFVALVEPALQALHTETGETVMLAVLGEDRHHSVRSLLSTHAVVAAPARIAEPRLHCTAHGRVLLAHAAPSVRTRLIDAIEAAGFPTFGPTTITSRTALETELERVRARGYASNYEEGRPGVIGQAAPVRDHSGAVIAAVGVAYPTMRRTAAYDTRMIAATTHAAEEASRLLGWPHR